MSSIVPVQPVTAFIDRWAKSGGAERANYVLFLTELCDILGVARPHPAGSGDDAYVFERDVTFNHADSSTSIGWIDLYKRGCFVLEAKQGSDQKTATDLPLFGKTGSGAGKAKKGTAVRGTKGWDDAMLRARAQAESYAKALPVEEGWPPMLVVVDVGFSIELFADFSRTGKHYTHFPDSHAFRIKLADLARDDIRERLRLVWTDPVALDPSRRSAKVTREIADHLAKLAKSLEASGHAPQRASAFLMRCLFTMFAEDVELLPKGCFTKLLEDVMDAPAQFGPLVKALWEDMNRGADFSPAIRSKVLKFNGGLFKDADAIPLQPDQIALLLEAAKARWNDVEPAIFGTLLERALDPHERHKLGAHYTPRAYVERLVMPTVIEPLREEWDNVKVAVIQRAAINDDAEGAIDEIEAFHRKLCQTKVLDPACGTGNFLYVTLEHMKRLEGEVLDLLSELGETQYLLDLDRHTVTPAQFLGIELNPRAAAIADLVIWIGFLQWHIRTKGNAKPAEPVLKDFKNIQCRDAVLDYDGTEMVRDEHGKPVTRWDGRSYKKHPVSGEDVPDETARVEVLSYKNPRPAKWPAADYVVGNPPFIGGWKMRQALGDGYIEALRSLAPHIPQKGDYVMFWWDRAAELTRHGKIRRFGLITTNSITQVFQRPVLAHHIEAKRHPLKLVFAVPDHPWHDLETDAAVRVAMTTGTAHVAGARLGVIECESGTDEVTVLKIRNVPSIDSALRDGVSLDLAVPLKANVKLASPGIQLFGAGFVLDQEEQAGLQQKMSHDCSRRIRPYFNGRDFVGSSRASYVIDFFPMGLAEVAQACPLLMQLVIERVKPHRDANRDPFLRENWWRFGRDRQGLREAIAGIERYIATPETAKHRLFQFFPSSTLPDNMVTALAVSDAYHLAVLSSRLHVTWALAVGGRLGVGNDSRYTKTRCFDPFPFPDPPEDLKARIHALGEELDAFRKARQAEHPDLTLTGMYNVLEKLRSGEALNAKDKPIHDKGLVSVLKDIHDRLDAAVFEAYGWPATLTDEEILERLVALNKERAKEEAKGHIRWLRPDFQAPKTEAAAKPVQTELDVGTAPATAIAAKLEKQPWPKTLPDQIQATRAALAALGTPADPTTVARTFKGAKSDKVAEVLGALAIMGQVRIYNTNKYCI